MGGASSQAPVVGSLAGLWEILTTAGEAGGLEEPQASDTSASRRQGSRLPPPRSCLSPASKDSPARPGINPQKHETQRKAEKGPWAAGEPAGDCQDPALRIQGPMLPCVGAQGPKRVTVSAEPVRGRDKHIRMWCVLCWGDPWETRGEARPQHE